MSKTFLVLVMVPTLIWAQSTTKKTIPGTGITIDYGPAQIRVRNGSDVDFKDVKVGGKKYGDIKAGVTTDYQVWEAAYRYAAVSLLAGSRSMAIRPIDYVGEPHLGHGYFTYVLTIEKDRLEIRAEKDTTTAPRGGTAQKKTVELGQTMAQAAAGNYPSEIGAYIKRDGQWLEDQPEVVNWKTGGVVKNIATAGIVKGDVNGNINGSHSRTAVKTPLEFIIVAPEGVAITEYQLIKLREQKDYREFRTVTGGVLHTQSGATRDLFEFEDTKVASRTFLVNLPTLGAAEYGFLPPGAFASSSSSGSIGKMYTFRISD